jgi:hypothetical protein
MLARAREQVSGKMTMSVTDDQLQVMIATMRGITDSN